MSKEDRDGYRLEVDRALLVGRWARPACGFTWRTGLVTDTLDQFDPRYERVKSMDWLVPSEPPPYVTKSVRFLQAGSPIPAAFERLAQEPSPTGILRFADAYGLLGHWEF